MLRVWIAACTLAIFAADAYGQSVLINEVMASNGDTVADEDGDFEDWIELYNPTSAPVDLKGYWLTDDADDLLQWQIPDTTLGAGDFLLIWASGKDRAGETLHTSFRIDRAGEVLILLDPDGTEIDRLDPTPVPRDYSFGRRPDGSENWVYFADPTPGAPNLTEPLQGFVDPPGVSHASGFFSDPFDLELFASDTLTELFYTLDGSMPSRESRRYEGPINIYDRTTDPNVISMIRTSPVWNLPVGQVPKGTVVRAVAKRSGFEPSDVVTHTYLVGDGPHARADMPVVSIATDSTHLFAYDDGIYVPGRVYDEERDTSLEYWQHPGNYSQRGREWERPIHLEVFENNGESVASLDAGIRVHGGATRTYPIKGLRLYFRSDYDEQNTLGHPIFVDQERDDFKRLILRPSGNDASFTLFRDVFMQRLVENTGIETQDSRTALVYVNGEFWGMHHIRERYDHRYVENVHGVDRDLIDMLELAGDPIYGDSLHYQVLLDHLGTGEPSAPEWLDEAESLMDVDDFISYQISQIYFGNTDWPHNNIRFWRKQTPSFDPEAPPAHDGRWRWLLYDVDFGYGLYGRAPWDNTLMHALQENDYTTVLRSLLRNDTFRARFLNAFADRLNTTFQPARAQLLIDSLRTHIAPVIADHTARWRWPASVGSWEHHISQLEGWNAARPEHQFRHLTSRFGLATSDVIVDVDGFGTVTINSVELEKGSSGLEHLDAIYPWRGRYFSGVPIRLIATPAPGYRLKGWDGLAETADTVWADPSDIGKVTARFEREAEYAPLPYRLANGAYRFTEWQQSEPAGTYPPNMIFRQSRDVDPGVKAEILDPYELAYDLESRTRIVGMGTGGIAFINTGTSNDVLEGAAGRDLGDAVLAIDATGVSGVTVNWRGTTVRPNEREYGIRLQYRLDDHGDWIDVVDEAGQPVEYIRNEVAGHARDIGRAVLPAEVDDQPYVQIRWRYYYRDGDSGPRAMLGVSNILVEAQTVTSIEDTTPVPPASCAINNYPNPFASSTEITFCLQKPGKVTVSVYSLLGRLVHTLHDGPLNAGDHSLAWKAGKQSSGAYIIRIDSGSASESRVMMLIR
jgi:hypothetical protein